MAQDRVAMNNTVLSPLTVELLAAARGKARRLTIILFVLFLLADVGALLSFRYEPLQICYMLFVLLFIPQMGCAIAWWTFGWGPSTLRTIVFVGSCLSVGLLSRDGWSLDRGITYTYFATLAALPLWALRWSDYRLELLPELEPGPQPAAHFQFSLIHLGTAVLNLAILLMVFGWTSELRREFLAQSPELIIAYSLWAVADGSVLRLGMSNQLGQRPPGFLKILYATISVTMFGVLLVTWELPGFSQDIFSLLGLSLMLSFIVVMPLVVILLGVLMMYRDYGYRLVRGEAKAKEGVR